MKRTEGLRRTPLRITLLMIALCSGVLASEISSGTVPSLVWQQRFEGNVGGNFLRSDDGRVVVSGGDTGTLWIWHDGLPGRRIREPDPSETQDSIGPLAISDDDRYLLFKNFRNDDSAGTMAVLELASGGTIAQLPARIPGQSQTYFDVVIGFKNGKVYYKNNGFISVFDVTSQKTIFAQKMQSNLNNTKSCIKSDGTLIYSDDKLIHIVDPNTWKESYSINLSLMLPGDGINYAYSCDFGKNQLYMKINISLPNAKGYLENYNREFIYNYENQTIDTKFSNNSFKRAEEKNYIYIFQGYGLITYPRLDTNCQELINNGFILPFIGTVSGASRLIKIRDGSLVSKLCRSAETNYLDSSMLPIRLWVNNNKLEYSNDDEDQYYDFQSGLIVKRYGETPTQIIKSPCGRFNVVSLDSGVLLLEDAESGQVITHLYENSRSALRGGNSLSGISWNAAESILSTASFDGLVYWKLPARLKSMDCGNSLTPFNRQTQNLPSLQDFTLLKPDSAGQLAPFSKIPTTTSISPDGRKAAMAFMNGDVQLWNLHEKMLISRWHDQHASVLNLAWSPSGRSLAYSNEAGQVWNHDLQTGAVTSSGPLAPPRDPDQDTAHQPLWIRAIQWSPDGSRLAIAGSWGELLLWQPNRSPTRLLTTHSVQQGLTALQWSQDGRHLITGQRDGGMKVVDLSSGVVLHAWSTGQDAILSLTVQGQRVTALSRDKTVSQWLVDQPGTP